MKKISPVLLILACASSVAFSGCDENLSKNEYATLVVNIYSEYEQKFDEIIAAIQSQQRVTADSLCDEASKIMDDMIALEPPVAFSDEDERLEDYCKNEKEKLSLQKEYMKLVKDEENITPEQKERISEITERMSVLSLNSDKFYRLVDEIAGKQLETQTEPPENLLER
ncbi:MAG: hypothetical protein E7505_07265 [Ruminococcus sp.]|nr:hypothetical protein [Ruminococcus sp.]